MRVALFVSCLVDQLWPAAAVAAVEVLRRSGCEVEFDPRQTCCGQPAFNAGHQGEARRVARHFLEVMAATDAAAIVVLSGSCGSMIKRHLQELFDGRERERALALAEKTHEFASFLVRELGIESVGGSFGGRLVYHDACHGLRELGVHDEPRRLLRALGAEVVEFPAGPLCCGFGGSFAVKQPELSVAMVDRRLQGLADLDAAAIVSGDVSCLLQIEGRLRRESPANSLPVHHLAELLVARGSLPS